MLVYISYTSNLVYHFQARLGDYPWGLLAQFWRYLNKVKVTYSEKQFSRLRYKLITAVKCFKVLAQERFY
jgi:hypothetical protein